MTNTDELRNEGEWARAELIDALPAPETPMPQTNDEIREQATATLALLQNPETVAALPPEMIYDGMVAGLETILELLDDLADIGEAYVVAAEDVGLLTVELDALRDELSDCREACS